MDEKLFNIVRKGYDQSEVDSHLKELYAVINSYKEKDNAIKNAIINAQISADNIIKNAEIEGDRIKGKAVKLLDEIQESIGAKKRIIHEFQDDYNRLINKYLQSIGNSEIEKISEKISELETYVTSMQKIQEANVQHHAEALAPQYSAHKMVSGVPRENLAPPVRTTPVSQDTGISDTISHDTVAVVAELLAKDSARNN